MQEHAPPVLSSLPLLSFPARFLFSALNRVVSHSPAPRTCSFFLLLFLLFRLFLSISFLFLLIFLPSSPSSQSAHLIPRVSFLSSSPLSSLTSSWLLSSSVFSSAHAHLTIGLVSLSCHPVSNFRISSFSSLRCCSPSAISPSPGSDMAWGCEPLVPCLAPFGLVRPLSPSSLAVFLCGQILFLCLHAHPFLRYLFLCLSCWSRPPDATHLPLGRGLHFLCLSVPLSFYPSPPARLRFTLASLPTVLLRRNALASLACFAPVLCCAFALPAAVVLAVRPFLFSLLQPPIWFHLPTPSFDPRPILTFHKVAFCIPRPFPLRSSWRSFDNVKFFFCGHDAHGVRDGKWQMREASGWNRKLPHLWQFGQDIQSHQVTSWQEAQVVAQSWREQVVAQNFADATFLRTFFQTDVSVVVRLMGPLVIPNDTPWVSSNHPDRCVLIALPNRWTSVSLFFVRELVLWCLCACGLLLLRLALLILVLSSSSHHALDLNRAPSRTPQLFSCSSFLSILPSHVTHTSWSPPPTVFRISWTLSSGDTSLRTVFISSSLTKICSVFVCLLFLVTTVQPVTSFLTCLSPSSSAFHPSSFFPLSPFLPLSLWSPSLSPGFSCIACLVDCRCWLLWCCLFLCGCQHGVRDRSVDFPGIRHLCLSVWTRPPKITFSIVKFIPVDVHTLSNVWALFVDVEQYLAVLVNQSLAVSIAQIDTEGINSDVRHNASHKSLAVKFPSNSDLSCSNDHVVPSHRCHMRPCMSASQCSNSRRSEGPVPSGSLGSWRFSPRTATVGSQLSSPWPAPVELARPTQQGHREPLWSREPFGSSGSVSAQRQGCQRPCRWTAGSLLASGWKISWSNPSPSRMDSHQC